MNEPEPGKLFAGRVLQSQLLICAAKLRNLEILRFLKQQSGDDQIVGSRPETGERRVAGITRKQPRIQRAAIEELAPALGARTRRRIRKRAIEVLIWVRWISESLNKRREGCHFVSAQFARPSKQRHERRIE